MKYLRFISQTNERCAGIMGPQHTIQLVSCDFLKGHELKKDSCSQADVKEYLVPVDIPEIIGLAGTYAEHAKECQKPIPKTPLCFLKSITSLTAHKQPIVLPPEAPTQVDFEAELGVIIGRKARNVPVDKALEYVFGYTCVNDISARDCQALESQWARAKSFDTFAPVGPVVETELDPTTVRIRFFLNGECLQDDNTKNLVFSVAEIISVLSRNKTLLPGTLIMTGTPAGVGVGRNPKIFLKPGDKLVLDIEGIGALENFVVATGCSATIT
jgi:2-keto-4-pentenoate hydratase/2-oxohepta-3-ene-1,7-dioic acid hydratase in catechol pathway